ncbi:hypothetical protein C8R48DRAFT_780610 [Suillus tomentosus]|nr:hypothetical protein C8R48DRAFT_780610 [Suillus tomentosus]
MAYPNDSILPRKQVIVLTKGDRGWPATTIKVQRSSEFLFLVNCVRVPCTSSNTHSVKRITPEPAILNANRPKSLSLNIAFTNYAHIYYRIPNRHEPLPPKHNRYTNPFRLYNADVFKCLSDSSTARSHSCMRILQRRQWLVFNTMALDPGHMNRVGDTMLILFRSFVLYITDVHCFHILIDRARPVLKLQLTCWVVRGKFTADEVFERFVTTFLSYEALLIPT